MAESTAAVVGPVLGAGGADIAAADAGALAFSADAAAQAAAGTMSVADALSNGATASQLIQAGLTGDQLAQAGLTAEQIAQAGGTAAQLEGAAAGIPEWATQNAAAAAGEAAQTAAYNTPAAATSLSDLLGYAKTGSQLIGGIGQLGQAASLLGGGATKPGVADPYAQYRSQAASQLQNLLANPSTITSTPGYQFNLQQGLQAQQAQQAAQGRLVSGGGLLQAQQFGQQYATSNLQQQQALLAQLSGATQAPAGAAPAQQGINFGQAGLGALGLQQLSGGAANVINPLQTLYSQYNQSSPSVS